MQRVDVILKLIKITIKNDAVVLTKNNRTWREYHKQLYTITMFFSSNDNEPIIYQKSIARIFLQEIKTIVEKNKK